MEKDVTQHTIGIMDPNSLSFRDALEGLIANLQPRVTWKGKTHKIVSRRIMSRPYNACGVSTSCDLILNRGAHWNPHHNSFFMIVRDKTYLLNDMISLQGIIKNTSYAHMNHFGMHIPKTVALPQFDNTALKENKNELELELIFSEYERFNLAEYGEFVGYPAFLKPQDGGGWVGVEKVENPTELHQKFHQSGDKPMNLQEAIDFREFVRTVGIGPQMIPMHYNASAKHSHDRYMRGPFQAVQHEFLSAEEYAEIVKIAKVINAFYGWDHNSCETLIDKQTGTIHPIDYCNAYPDSNLISLHYYFPELVKNMVRWFLFVVVTGKKKPLDFAYDWDRYFAVAKDFQSGKLAYPEALDRYAALADEHFQTEDFEDFCKTALNGFDEAAYGYFSGSDFTQLIDRQVRQYFKIPQEQPEKIVHYRGIHQYWLHCERVRLKLDEQD
jgi:hypothetical protein